MIDRILSERRIIITCGTGGVGKTTLSAAIAIRAAMRGKKTVVVTVDPAKRLATSLGLEKLGNDPTDLTPRLETAIAQAKAAGRSGLPESVTGTLDAIVPDTRHTFESFIRDLAKDEALAQRVMRNPIFQIFAKEFSGANEYMALERLYALDQLGKYDCIVLDTPPSRNTLDFLDAPRLLAKFFEERLIRWLVLPANRLVSAGMRKALSVLERLTGAGFMTSLLDFATALFEVQANFTANLKTVTTLLESPGVGFVMVSSPSPELVDEAAHFIESLRKHRFRFDGIALNRTLSYLGSALPVGVASPGAEGKATALAIVDALQKREGSVAERLRKSGVPIIAILPELARDVHSVEDLLYVSLAFDSASAH